MVTATMEAALNHRPQTRGPDLLIHHCRTIGGGMATLRPSARKRLEQAIGIELARLLLSALVPAVQGWRGSSSP